MKVISLFMLLAACILVVLAAGCTTTSTPAATVTPTPEVIYVTVTVTPTATTTNCYWNPQTMSCSDKPFAAPTATAAVTTATTAAPDPILHRWIRQYGDGNGYEFRFYPDGTAIYKQGPIITVNQNLKIPSPVTSGSGSWSKMGSTDYQVRIWYPGDSGAPDIIRDYTIVPQYATIPLHLVSSYEQADVDTATANGTIHSFSTDVFYLEQAPQDAE
ncbi:hypothetical protein [Methanoregula sp.]|uniref:hypothetical protein n=1 Tax=Methanoregula sp. TaxID=2052170 RepID=UPI002CFB6FE1|nr:hypothetical protein [Methanoregula sp.]HVP96812.1 hypothetical protein [Methanoregula sp.]